ncbi:hypothetical protein HBNXHr_0146 [Halorhabdus sp. BNX81]|nr:hypothetical protein HBNXHr_0146 [Halorhabdus sp. BNX81]
MTLDGGFEVVRRRPWPQRQRRVQRVRDTSIRVPAVRHARDRKRELTVASVSSLPLGIAVPEGRAGE